MTLSTSRTGRHHHQHPAGPLENSHELVGRVRAADSGIRGLPRRKRLCLSLVKVVARYREAPARDVAREVRAHDAQAYDTDLVSH